MITIENTRELTKEEKWGLALEPLKVIPDLPVIPKLETPPPGSYYLFDIHSQDDFIRALWYIIMEYDISPIGYDRWEQSAGKSYNNPLARFFKRGYKRYIKSSGYCRSVLVKDFAGEDKYIMQSMDLWDPYNKIYVIKIDLLRKSFAQLEEICSDDYKERNL